MTKRMNVLKFLSVAVVLGLALMTQGCAKDGGKQAAARPEGGVDGSGGLLPFLDEAGFEDWVVNEHPFYIRDTIHRLELIRQHSSKDLQKIPYDLPARFLMEKPGDLQKIADGLTYYTVPGFCQSTNHGPSDASISPDGRVCFSHRAFRNLSVKEAIPKLISMTMHELAHQRGFDESDAVKWQLLFDRTFLGEATILVWNENYRRAKETLKKIGQRSASAMQVLLSREENSDIRACRYLAQAKDRFEDFFYLVHGLPAHLKDPALDLFQLIDFTAVNCDSIGALELMDKLGPILKSMLELREKYSQYDSPLCEGELCAGTRFISYELEESLWQWKAKRAAFARRENYRKVDFKKISCKLENLTARSEVELKKNEHGHFDLKHLNSAENQLGVRSLGFTNSFFSNYDESDAVVELSHLGAVQLLESSGFSAGPYDIRGLLVPNTLEKISMKFALMDPQLRAPVRREGELMPAFDIPYGSRDPYFYAIRKMPTVIQEFRLSCELGK